MSKQFRFLTDNIEFIGDKGYKGCKYVYVKVCEDKYYKINFKPSNPPTFKETALILVGTS